jgi:hypothetical protein
VELLSVSERTNDFSMRCRRRKFISRQEMRISIWYCFFAIIWAGGFSFLIFPTISSRLEIPDVNFRSPFLLDFEKRLSHYQDNWFRYHNVIIGPSYAVDLGEFNDFANLSMSATRLEERRRFLQYCRSEDTAFYFVSLPDSITASLPPRPEVIYSPIRRLKILRMTFSIAPLDDRPPITEYREFLRTLQTMKTLDFSNVIVHCQRVLKEHPRIVFVVFPLCSGKLGRDMSGFERDFQMAFQESKLPYLNLCDIYEEKDFRDFTHLTYSGIVLTRSTLKSFVEVKVPTILQQE